MLYYLFVSMFVLITVHRILKETHLTSSVLFSENHQTETFENDKYL